MLIAFEGPDNTGKSTSAKNLTHNGESIYNATKENHWDAKVDLADEGELVQCFDRIDWFSHMVYRLALPEHEWKDQRVRTVFSMPDTHLVVKLHHPSLAGLISDELYTTGTLAQVNPLYFYFADFFTGLNEERDFSMFKTISIMEVFNDPRDGSFSQHLVSFSSPVTNWDMTEMGEITTDEKLLELLRYDEDQRL